MKLQPLFKAALITSPVIAGLLVTPVFLLSGIKSVSIWVLLPVAGLIVFFFWCLQLLLLKKFTGLRNYKRLIIATGIGIIASTFGLYFVYPFLHLPYPIWQIHILRCINIFFINSIIFIISNYILLSQTKKELDTENQQLKFANLEARYQTLRNQVNPHFLFNSIGTAKALIRKNPMIADEYLIKLSDFLRLGFDNKMDAILVKEELALCRDYIALQQMRFGEALHFKSNLEVKYESFMVPHFSLLSLVENAVKHNSMTEEDPLIISVTNEADFIIIENNVQQKFLLETSSKTGLNNLAERYRLLYNEPVKIESGETTFRVTIKMMRQ